MWRRLLNLLVALDRLAYVVVTLGNGTSRETLSGAAWRVEQKGGIFGRIFRPAIDFVFRPFEREHCRRQHERDSGLNVRVQQ